jgi:hypothetical protein
MPRRQQWALTVYQLPTFGFNTLNRVTIVCAPALLSAFKRAAGATV